MDYVDFSYINDIKLNVFIAVNIGLTCVYILHQDQ